MTTTPEETEAKTDDETHDGEETPEGPPRSLWREYFESGAVVLVMAMFFMTFVAQAAEVPSASMENTVYVGDRFLINRFIFGPGPHLPFLPQRDIRRGDIIVFKYPSDYNTDKTVVQYKTLFIKRVIGLPGETIEVRGPDVLINGKVLPEYRITARDARTRDKAELRELEPPPHPRADEPYTVYYSPETIESAGRGERASNYGFKYGVGKPFQIPSDAYFVMGDNRDNSADSRVWGTVPRDLIVGRAMFVIWSSDLSAPPAKSWTDFIEGFFKNTRWRRIGTFIR